MSGKSVAKTAITAMMVACTVPFAADANDWEPPHFKMLDLIKEVMEVKIDHDSGVIDQKTARVRICRTLQGLSREDLYNMVLLASDSWKIFETIVTARKKCRDDVHLTPGN